MPGAVCLQGGGEFRAACAEMDRQVLARADAGPVVVLPLATSPGMEYRTAGRNGLAYYRDLGAATVRVAADPRTDEAAAVRDLADAALVVLPGGSPRRLLDGLRGTPVGRVVLDRHRAGAVLSGSSAGAMVLAAWTLLPGHGRPDAVPGLGLVADAAVVPHYRGDLGWAAGLVGRVPAAEAARLLVLGLPECAGVLVDAEGAVAVGATGVGAAPLGSAARRVEPGMSLPLRVGKP